MRVASTGLGQTELIADIITMKPKEELMGLYCEATSPAEWHLETYLDPEDMLPVVLGFLKPAVIWVIILSFVFFWRKGPEPEKL